MKKVSVNTYLDCPNKCVQTARPLKPVCEVLMHLLRLCIGQDKGGAGGVGEGY
jgi:hypothetical protein